MLASSNFIMGFLDSCHYNSSTLEKYHYNSAILKLAITILHTSEPCHFIRLLRAWARCQAVYVYVYSVGTKTLLLLHSLHSMTCGPHWSGSSSTRAPLLERSGKDRGGGPASSAAKR